MRKVVFSVCYFCTDWKITGVEKSQFYSCDISDFSAGWKSREGKSQNGKVAKWKLPRDRKDASLEKYQGGKVADWQTGRLENVLRLFHPCDFGKYNWNQLLLGKIQACRKKEERKT